MEIDGLKVLKGDLKDFNLEEFLNPDFLEAIKNEFEDVKFIQIGMASGPENKESILYLAHTSPENINNNTLTIGVSKEEQMNQILKVVKTFKGD